MCAMSYVRVASVMDSSLVIGMLLGDVLCMQFAFYSNSLDLGAVWPRDVRLKNIVIRWDAVHRRK